MSGRRDGCCADAVLAPAAERERWGSTRQESSSAGKGAVPGAAGVTSSESSPAKTVDLLRLMSRYFSEVPFLPQHGAERLGCAGPAETRGWPLGPFRLRFDLSWLGTFFYPGQKPSYVSARVVLCCLCKTFSLVETLPDFETPVIIILID